MKSREMKSSEILIEAKGYLWDGSPPVWPKHHHICDAISRALVKNIRVPYEKARDLRLEIDRRVRPHSSLRYWIKNEVYQGKEHRDLTPSNVQKHSHDWVDLLIKEYQAKGD